MDTYRLDEADMKLFHLYAFVQDIVHSELVKHNNFSINLGNDVAEYAIRNTAADQYFNYGNVGSFSTVNAVCKAMLRLITIYASDYNGQLSDILELKEKLRPKQPPTKAGKTKPVEIDPSVGIDFYADTTTKS